LRFAGVDNRDALPSAFTSNDLGARALVFLVSIAWISLAPDPCCVNLCGLNLCGQNLCGKNLQLRESPGPGTLLR